MPLNKFVFRPGVFKEGTDYDNEGGWFDANLVRFKAGRPQKIGGWRKDNLTTFLGTCRALHGWLTLTGTKLLGLGTNKKYYIEEGSTFNDITPLRSTTGAGDVTFAKVGNGDATITVSDTAHGAVVGDFVTYSGAASLGGNIVAAVLNQEYEIATIVNANSYTIEAKDTSGNTVLAAAGDSGNGGGSTVGAYQVTTGLDIYVTSTGWGVGLWGNNTWGSTTALTLGNQLRLWSHDNFDPSNTNTAGSLRLSEGSQIIGGVKARQEVLIWTDTALYSMQFIGPPFTFGLNLINDSSGLVSPKGAISSSSGVYWMGYDSFYVYNGSVQKIPCSVLSYVFDDFNPGQAFKVFAFNNSEFNEVGWFYPSASSDDIDRYVIYNYAEKVWTIGQLNRTAWLDSGVENYPRATTGSYLYEQEFGYDNDGSPMTNVFIESSDVDIDDGENFAFINRIIPDIKFLSNSSAGKVNLVLKTRDYPGDTLTTASTSQIAADTSKTDIRARARQITFRLESDDDAGSSGNDNVGWRLGATRLNVQPDGRR